MCPQPGSLQQAFPYYSHHLADGTVVEPRQPGYDEDGFALPA